MSCSQRLTGAGLDPSAIDAILADYAAGIERLCADAQLSRDLVEERLDGVDPDGREHRGNVVWRVRNERHASSTAWVGR